MPSHKTKWPLFFLLTALIPGHLFDWKVEWAFATMTTILGVIYFKKFSRLYPRGARIGLLALLTVISVSIVGYILTIKQSNFPTGIRDIVELLKPAMIFFSCTAALMYGTQTIKNLRKVSFAILTYSLICGLAIIIEIPIVAALVDIIYGSTKTGFSDYYFRLSIPFENPNFLGLFAVLSLAIGLNFSPRPDLKLVIASLCVVGLSGSRTALLTSAILLVPFSGIVLTRMITNIRSLSAASIFIAIMFPLTIVYFLNTYNESFQRVRDLIEILSSFNLSLDDSYAKRQVMRSEAINLFVERPIFGWGAIKYSSLDIVDNQYVSLLVRFGILGTTIVLIGAAVIIFKNLRSYARTKEYKNGVLMWLVLLAWLWTGTFLENIRLAIIITIIFTSVSTNHAKPAN